MLTTDSQGRRVKSEKKNIGLIGPIGPIVLISYKKLICLTMKHQPIILSDSKEGSFDYQTFRDRRIVCCERFHGGIPV